jgi:predicted MFS family arabinose efflux permease
MLVAFILSSQFWLGLCTMMLLGFCVFFTLAACNTWVQSAVNDDMRGRVLSLYYVAMAGVTPLGSLAGGWAAEHLGARVTLLVGALVGFVAGFIYLRRAQRRQAAGA